MDTVSRAEPPRQVNGCAARPEWWPEDATEPAPSDEKIEATREHLRRWAQAQCADTYSARSQPLQADWWCPQIGVLIDVHRYECGGAMQPGVYELIHELRGLDIELVYMLRLIREKSGMEPARRAIGLVAFVIMAWLDRRDEHVDEERDVARALYAIGCANYQGTEDISCPMSHAVAMMREDLTTAWFGDDAPADPFYDCQWLAWYLYREVKTPLDARWAVTCCIDALGHMLDALETDRRLDEEHLDPIAVFLHGFGLWISDGAATAEPPIANEDPGTLEDVLRAAVRKGWLILGDSALDVPARADGGVIRFASHARAARDGRGRARAERDVARAIAEILRTTAPPSSEGSR